MIQLAVVEDIDELREAMVNLFQSANDLLCVYSFRTGEEALSALSEDPVDVVLMDIHLPGISGIECVRQLTQKHPSMLILMCTVFQDDEHIFNALKAGAKGYLLKGDDPAAIISAIRELHAGGSPMNAHIARRVIASFQVPVTPAVREDYLLTKREEELLLLLSKGLRYKEIAAQLFISIETVRKHINNIYTKLQVQSRMEAVNKFYGEKAPNS